MNDTHDHTANAAGKKPRRWSAALTLIVGLALLLPGAAALATNKPISVDNLGSSGEDGAYQFNGQVGVVTELPGTKISIKNGKSGISEEANTVLGDVSTTRGTAPPPGGGDGELMPDELPGIAGDPIPIVPIGLEGDPGNVKVGTTTGADGTFHFDKLPAGKYKLILPGLPSQSLTVGADGIAGGKVMRSPDGSLNISIWDRWGNSAAKEADDVTIKGKAAKNLVGFGSGNLSTGPMGGGMGLGMSPPGGPGPGGPMSPGGPGPGGPMSHGSPGLGGAGGLAGGLAGAM
jgi:hypothetical protein